jgi:microcystin-dependent protein
MNQPCNRILAVLAAALLVSAALGASALDEPVARRIPYQGSLAGTTGPVTLVAELYDAPAAGTRVWGPELHAVTPDASGRFLIVLGSTNLDLCARQPDGSLDCSTGGDTVPDLDQIDASEVYLSLQVDDGTTTTTLSPRQQLFPAFQAASVTPGSIAIERLAAEVANALVPTGAVIAFAGCSAQVPEGWLLCDGQQLDQATNPALFSVIGTAHGGDASVFRVPDLRGMFLRGVDGGAGRDPDAATRFALFAGGNTGNAVGSFQDHLFQSHTHGSSSHAHSIGSDTHTHTLRASDITSSGGARVERSPGDSGSNVDLTAAVESDTHSHSISSASVGVLAPNSGLFGSETRPENVYMNYIIRCGPSDACQ